MQIVAIMGLEVLCSRLLEPLSRLPSVGIERLKRLSNPDGHDGVYLIRCSEKDAERSLEVVERTKNMATIAEMVRFVSREASDYDRLLDVMADVSFGEAVVRHDRKDTIIACCWVYAGTPVESEEVRFVPKGLPKA